MSTYAWDVHSHFRASQYKKVDPNVVGPWLEALRDGAGGRLKARDVVAAAADPSSPGHGCFTWDDRTCGRKWREQEAAAVVIAIRIVREGEREPARLFVNITDFAEAAEAQGRGSAALEALPGGYVDRRRALQTPEHRARLEARGYAEFASVMRRYEDLGDASQLGPIFAVVRDVGRKLRDSPDEDVRQVAAAWS